MGASSLTVRSGRRTVSPATLTFPARIRACARSRDSASPVLVTRTSNLGTLKEKPDHDAEHRPDQDLHRGVPKQLPELLLLHASHRHQVVDEPVQDGRLATRG